MMNATESNSTEPKAVITKMPGFEQAMRALVVHNFGATPNLTFYTPFVRRKFERNFYYLSLKLVELDKDLLSMALDPQEAFLASLAKLKQESILKDYPEWLGIAHSLQAAVLVVIFLTGRCLRLSRLFVKADAFLLPVYAAYNERRISKDEFEAIKNQVAVLFEGLKQSLEKLPRHGGVSKDRT